MRDGKQVTRDGHKEIQEGTKRTTISWKIVFTKRKRQRFLESQRGDKKEKVILSEIVTIVTYTYYISYGTYTIIHIWYPIPIIMLGQGKLKLNSPQDMKWRVKVVFELVILIIFNLKKWTCFIPIP